MNYGYKKAPFIGAENKENYKQYLCKRSIGGTLVDLPIFLDN